MDQCSRRVKASNVLLLCTTLVPGCSRNEPPPAPAPTPLPEFVLVVNNTTSQNVAVFFAEQKSHTRVGRVDAQRESRLPVQPYLLQKSPRVRVYMFRGPEPCPVARIVDFSISKTPRVTVATTDTVLSAYLPADGCRSKR